MIKRIQIKNFKCYGEPGIDLTLKRINFIFGDNSVGKSTFLQLLRLVCNDETGVIKDDFGKYVFKGELLREIKMRVTTTLTNSSEGVRQKTEIKTTELESVEEMPSLCYPVFEYRCTSRNNINVPLDNFSCLGVVSAVDFDAERRDKIQRSKKYTRNCLPYVIHVEAARPERFDLSQQKLLSSLDETLLLSSEAINYVNRFFRELKLPYTCLNRNTLRDEDFNITVSRKNIGAGIDSLYETALRLYEWTHYEGKNPLSDGSSNGCLLALEEPETHVNERQIEALVEFLFSEAEEVSHGQLFIECHSDLVLLKALQVLQRKALRITSMDVSVLYAQKTLDGTEMIECELDDAGNIFGWPDIEGFFPVRDRIIFGN